MCPADLSKIVSSAFTASSRKTREKSQETPSKISLTHNFPFDIFNPPKSEFLSIYQSKNLHMGGSGKEFGLGK
jgi:hypothetical protein